MGDVKKDKYIEISNSHEYRLFVDDNICDSGKFFYPVYRKSAELIKEIRSYADIAEEHCSENTADGAGANTNNLIMYCANRGGGKSSAMLSFGNALKSVGKDSEKKDGYNEFWGDISKCSFAVLDAIDPTSLCEKEGIMTIILSRLFLETRNIMKEKEKNERRDNICKNIADQSTYDIINKFRKCYKYINVINGTQKEFNDEEGDFSLEELASLGDSSNLKNEFYNLVRLFLKLRFEEEPRRNHYLVIQIDDADLNTSKSYDILEDLRKYCMVPNIIILMAVNMPQMHQVVEQHFVREYEALLRARVDKSAFIGYDDIKDMAVRYINKVMPETHQIYLPQIDDFLRSGSSSLNIIYKKSDEKNSRDNQDALSYYQKGTVDTVTGYQERLIRLVYRKTGIAMVIPDSYVHNFMPQNMRELTHFLSFMCSLPDIKPDLNYSEMFSLMYSHDENLEISGYKKTQAENELSIRRSNLDAFMKFFLYGWCDINLTKEEQKNMILLSESTAYINVSIAQGIVSRYMGEDKPNESHKSESSNNFNSSFSPAQSNENHVPPLSYESISGLMQNIDRISDSGKSGQDAVRSYKFAYALRLYFTILLHREMLISIENKSFANFRKLAGCEIWSPDYRRFTDYPMFGRFTVNYPVYLNLKRSMPNDDASRSSLSGNLELNSVCYLNIQGKAYFIDNSKPNIRKTLSKLENSIPCDAKIICDIGYMMLNEVTSESSYQDYNLNNLHMLNDMLLVLLNWDVRHYVEKNIQEALDGRVGSRLRLRDPDREIEWYKRFCLSVLNEVDPLSQYLRSTDEDNIYFNVLDPVQFKNVLYANAGIQEAYVSHILSRIRTLLDSPVPSNSDLSENSNRVLRICTDILPAVKRIWFPQFNYIRQFSKNADRIMNEFDALDKAFSNLVSLINEERGTTQSEGLSRGTIYSTISKSEKIKSYLDEHESELMHVYTGWYNNISMPNLERWIIEDIDRSFGAAVTAKKNGGKK